MTAFGPFDWSDALLTGVAEIDKQHRILVGMLVEAQAKLTDDTSGRLLEHIIRDLLAYAIYHFDTEQQLMREYGYGTAEPGQAALHLAQHRLFSEQVVALRADARTGEHGVRDALLRFLKDWLTDHILTTDKRLGQFILSRTQDP